MGLSTPKILRSIVSPQYISELISNEYGFTGDSSCKLIKSGGSNDIYLFINKHNKYIVKVYSIRKCWSYTKNHYQFEVDFQNYLFNNEISLPKPVSNIRGHTINEIRTPEYNKFYIIYTFLEGIPLQPQTYNIENFCSLGQHIGKLHDKAKGFSPSLQSNRYLDIDFLLSSPYERLQQCGLENSFSNLFSKKINKIYKNLKLKINSIRLDNLKTGIIHGDMHPENFFIYKDKDCISFLDFELSGYGYYVYDLATFKWKLSLLDNHKELDAKFKNLIDGYLIQMPELFTDILHLDVFTQLRHFFILGSSIILYPDNPQLIYEENLINYIKSFQIDNDN
jgi:Ser/Thr protein kinase RdoA (MazF antagonist)